MQQRVVRFFAIVIIVLAVSPFTAPFSTCDFSLWHTVSSTPQPMVTAAKITTDGASTAAAVTFVLVAVLGLSVVDLTFRAERPERSRAPQLVLRL